MEENFKEKYSGLIECIKCEDSEKNDKKSSKYKIAQVGSKDAEMLDAYSRAVISVVESVGPAVVSISISDNNRIEEEGVFQPVGAGSGVIIAPDGYILTNSHVVSGIKNIEVTSYEQKKLKALVIGDDPETDLAIIKVNSSGLEYASLGNSSILKVGQLVIAVGNPFGFQSTVSTGVISAIGRSLRAQNGTLIENIIQHTAPLNPGNSGGPLLDSKGKIIGLNTAIIQMAQGIGFAIPSKTIERVVTQLMTIGRVKRYYLGISGTTRQVSQRFVRFHNLKSNYVVEVLSIDKNSPAYNADMHMGDFIININKTDILTIDDIYHILSDESYGDSLEIEIIRRENKIKLNVNPIEKK